jgi:hypothetical protein
MRLTEIGNQPQATKINKVVESRFGFKIDYDNLTLKKAYTLATAITESLDKVRRTHGTHTAEKNSKYMEMLMVRESLHRWMVENKPRFIAESEMAKSEAILAAKDMVDSMQDMLEKIGKMQNEQLPALLDTIRDQIGEPQADAFKGKISPLLAQLWQTINSGRETADGAARELTGEAPSGMDMGGMGGSDMGGDMGGDLGAPPAPEEGDGFGATDAAAGTDDELGRERRGVEENKKAKPDFLDLNKNGNKKEPMKKAAKDAKAKK